MVPGVTNQARKRQPIPTESRPTVCMHEQATRRDAASPMLRGPDLRREPCAAMSRSRRRISARCAAACSHPLLTSSGDADIRIRYCQRPHRAVTDRPVYSGIVHRPAAASRRRAKTDNLASAGIRVNGPPSVADWVIGHVRRSRDELHRLPSNPNKRIHTLLLDKYIFYG